MSRAYGQRKHAPPAPVAPVFATPAEFDAWAANLTEDELDAWVRATHATTLDDYVRRVAPQHVPMPPHLGALYDIIERAASEPVRVLISMPPRHAKAVADDTPMLTRRGWVPAGSVRVGDALVGSDGRWTRVRGVYPQGTVPRWRVRFTDGTAITTCGEHRWQVHQRYSGRGVVRTTEELRHDLHESDARCKWRIPVAAPWCGTQPVGAGPLPLDPYLLGAWLGDGTSRDGAITTMDQPIIDAFINGGFAVRSADNRRTGRATTYRLVGLTRALRTLGVFGNKHVPEAYLFGTAATRLAVLQGLADTGGTVAKNGSQQSICTTREQLAADIRFLVVSLGGVYTETTTQPKRGKLAHNIYFRLPAGMSGFRLARKASRLAAPSARNRPRRFVAAVEPVDAGPATCFEVAAADHLFCAGRDLIVTHNTESIIHGLGWLTKRLPHRLNAYVSYNERQAHSKSRRVRREAMFAGVDLSPDAAAVADWRTRANGGLLATGIGGSLTGQGVTGLMVVDDPFKDRASAESPVIRDHVWEWFTDVAYTRLEPGAGCVVVATRWHADDLIGRLQSFELGDEWEVLNLPAVRDPATGVPADVGEPLWPAMYPLPALKAIRSTIGEYAWASLYQGHPVPRGGKLFTDATHTEDVTLPVGHRVVVAVDPAGTESTRADHTAAVVLAVTGTGATMRARVLEVLRLQKAAPEIAAALHALQLRRGNARLVVEATRDGAAIVASLKRINANLQFHMVPPQGDKYTRAQAVASAWAEGRVVLPAGPTTWAKDFLEEVYGFTGIADRHDDQVDALAHAWNYALATGGATTGPMPTSANTPRIDPRARSW